MLKKVFLETSVVFGPLLIAAELAIQVIKLQWWAILKKIE